MSVVVSTILNPLLSVGLFAGGCMVLIIGYKNIQIPVICTLHKIGSKKMYFPNAIGEQNDGSMKKTFWVKNGEEAKEGEEEEETEGDRERRVSEQEDKGGRHKKSTLRADTYIP